MSDARGREITVTASIATSGGSDSESANPSGKRKAVLRPTDGTLDLLTRWQEGDQVMLYVKQDGKVYTLDPVPVRNISADGKSCSLVFKLPSAVDAEKAYTLYGLYGIEGMVADTEVLAKSQLTRKSWADGKAMPSPMWFQAAGGPMSLQAHFQHLGTYEVLHVKNTSGKPITFQQWGFDVDVPWYKYEESTPLREDYDPSQYVTEPGDVESDVVTIDNGKTVPILSWYMPSGGNVSNAHLQASVDGRQVTSANTKSSTVKIQRGRAYHMYATWDGSELSFDDGEIDELKGKFIKVEPSTIDMGDIPVGTSKKAQFTVSNIGTESLAFKVPSNTSYISIPDGGVEFTLHAGDEKSFDIYCAPFTVNYGFGSRIYIETDAENGEQYIDVFGTAVPSDDGSSFVSCPDGNHPHLIDLGLPSGIKWACCNVGASMPDGKGGYYAWGEISEKDNYTWDSYRWSGDNQYSMTKYCYDSHYGIVDNKTYLDPSDDVAYMIWGSNWRMPSKEEQDELRENCDWEWVNYNGINGMRVKSRVNGKCIFLPAAGYKRNSSTSYLNEYGYYQSASLDLTNSDDSYYFYFNSSGHYWQDFSTVVGRDVGFSVRPVSDTSSPLTPGEAIDLGLPSGTKWASCNVGASSPEEYGGYYAWGETEEKEVYDLSTYKWCNGSYYSMTKYCTSTSYGTVDGKTTLDPEDDVAHVKWGGNWHMPTSAEKHELYDNCSSEWTTLNGVYGRKFTGPNGNSIFLPAAGSRRRDKLYYLGSEGYYWSSSLYVSESQSANDLDFDSDSRDIVDKSFCSDRSNGLTVRPVLSN